MVKIVLIGHLGGDPDFIYTKKGEPLLSFSLAINRRRQVDGEWVTEATWWKIAYKREDGEELSLKLRKGDEVIVRGEEVKSTAYRGRGGEVRGELHLKASLIQLAGSSGGSYKRPEDIWD